jgi:hypothetical protein
MLLHPMSQGSGGIRAYWLLCMAVASVWSGAAAAAEEPASPAPKYVVAADCAPRAAWRAALQARLREGLREHPALDRFSVNIQRARSARSGPFRYTGEVGSVTASAAEARSVSGGSCPEVLEALTLIAALELQRIAADERAVPAPEAPEQHAEAAAGQRADGLVSAEMAPDPERLRIGAIGFAWVQSITSPRLATDLGLGITFSWQAQGLQPWLMFGVYGGGEETAIQEGAARVRFARWATYVVACPVRFPRSAPAALRPCVNADLGRITGTGLGVSGAARSSAVLASTGLDLRVEWSVLEHLELGAVLGGVVTLARPHFFFAPELTALSVPPVGIRTGASASLSF